MAYETEEDLAHITKIELLELVRGLWELLPYRTLKRHIDEIQYEGGDYKAMIAIRQKCKELFNG